MSTTITLKNIPDDVHAALRPTRVSVEDRLIRIRALRQAGPVIAAAEELDEFKRQGRP